jgi:hypothetical protein
VIAGTLLRVRYAGSHAADATQLEDYNTAPPDYIYYATTHQPKPTGALANVALRPFDNTVLGTVQEYVNSGVTNTEAISVQVQRRTKNYTAELTYTMTNALTTGASTQSASQVPDTQQFLPGAVPTDYTARDMFLNYQRDTGIAKHYIQYDWATILPVGNGKKLLSNANRLVDTVVGGWQLEGIGTFRSNYFALPTTNWNFTGVPIQQYGYKYPIQNCTSGACIPGYLWWNGYIPANQINSHDANGNPNGYEGIPANYQPAVTPLIPFGSTTLPPNAPANTNISQFAGTNTAWVPLQNGTVQQVAYTGLNPWRNQLLPGPNQWNVDASLSKTFVIHENLKFRLAADVFNVFNHPNNPNTIGGDGFLNAHNSGLAARILQLGGRLNW